MQGAGITRHKENIMHSHIEIIIPPCSNVAEAVDKVMKGTCDDEDECGWWDWYVIGGRWSGEKEQCSYDKKAIKAFNEEMNENKITISALICGKEEISPASQIPIVDAIWRKHFPGRGDVCPFFAHGRNQYKRDGYPSDVCCVKDIHPDLTSSRVVIAIQRPEGLKAVYMLVQEIWNSISWQETLWKGNVLDALKMYAEFRKERNHEYYQEVRQDWLAVTVDIHN